MCDKERYESCTGKKNPSCGQHFTDYTLKIKFKAEKRKNALKKADQESPQRKQV